MNSDRRQAFCLIDGGITEEMEFKSNRCKNGFQVNSIKFSLVENFF